MTLQDPDRFEGAAFHPSFPKGRTSGTIGVQPTQLKFRWNGGEVEMPLSSTKVEMGGAANRLVFFKSDALPDWSIYTSDASILNHHALREHPNLAGSVGKHRRRRTGIRFGYGAILAIIAGLVLAFIGARHWMVASLANQVPASWEAELGDQAMAQLKMSLSLVDSPAAAAELKTLTDSLLNAMPEKRHEYQFYIVEDGSLNAMALPGGHILVHTGLLRAAENEEQILGVLAHEIAHVEYRHGLRNIINSLGVVVLLQAFIGDATVFYGILMKAVPYLLKQDFSRDMERDADARGMDILRQAGVDPRGMVGMFEIMRDQLGTAAETSDQLNFLSSHPSLAERIETLNNQLADADPTNYRRFDGVLTRLIAGLDNHQAKQEEGQDANNH